MASAASYRKEVLSASAIVRPQVEMPDELLTEIGNRVDPSAAIPFPGAPTISRNQRSVMAAGRGWSQPAAHLTSAPPQLAGSTSATVCEKVQRWPTRSSAVYCRSPYTWSAGGATILAPAASAWR